MQIRQSVKLILAAYGICGLIEGLIVAYWLVSDPHPTASYWALLAIPFAGQVWAAARHAEKLATTMNVDGGRIRYESGILSRTTRTLELSKIQDVRVDQSPMQRMLNIGNLSLETAGESGRLEMPSIDRPSQVADQLLDLARQTHTH
jgi:membrane protein YdbS with pleckstrin-like domain